MSNVAPRRIQGIARYTFLIVLALLLTGGGVIFWLLTARAQVDAAAPEVVAAAGPVIRDGAGIDELLQRARQAMVDQRLLSPAGNNAFELYLSVLKRDPGNRVAQDALREIFPFAAHAAEQAIDDGNDAEAQREIELLARADPHNYTLTLLRSKLQEQRDAVAQQAQQADQRAAAAAALTHRTPPASPAPASAPALPLAAAPAPPQATAGRPTQMPDGQSLALLHVQSTPVEPAPRAVAHPRASTVDANGAAAPVLTRRVEPAYPAEARRTRREGWVDVTFTVQADGSVAGATVADADPKNVFDRAALVAVSHWQFSPGMQDGKPVTAQLRQHIEFRL